MFVKRVYLANLDPELFPVRCLNLLLRMGWQATGNFYECGATIDSVQPDVIVYVPTRRPDALRIHSRSLRGAQLITWVLYPDQVTGWDVHSNCHDSKLMLRTAWLFKKAARNLANSAFTKRLMERVASPIRFEVCRLGIDHVGISKAIGDRFVKQRPRSVLWQHRWSADKNPEEAFEIVTELANRYPAIRFYLGRWEDWQPYYVTRPLVKRFRAFVQTVGSIHNITPVRRFDRQVDFWAFLKRIDVGFSTAYHESFGLAMLEQAFAGAACVVPNLAAYPEVHGGALVVPMSQIADSVSRLLDDDHLWRYRAEASYRNALLYDVDRSAMMLLSVLDVVAR